MFALRRVSLVRSRRRSGLAAVAVLVSIALAGAGCSSSDDADESTASASASATASGSASASGSATASAAAEDDAAEDAAETGAEDDAAEDAAGSDEAAPTDDRFPITVTDALGEVEIPAAPMRVIALDLSLVDPALILGLEVVGYTTFNDPEGPLPDLYGAAVDEYASEAMWVGDLLAPNLELVAAAQPDLILTSAVRHQAIRDELTAIAPTVMTDSAGAGWKESLRLVAAAVGQTPDAEAAIADYEARAAALGTRINETHDDPTLSVVRFVDVIRLYQPNSFSGVVLTDVGLARPDSQQLTDDFISVISEEELAQADADFLVYAVFDDPAVTSTVDQLVDSPLWTDLDAVAAGRAFPVADDRWMSGVGLFGAEAILEDLAEIFELES